MNFKVKEYEAYNKMLDLHLMNELHDTLELYKIGPFSKRGLKDGQIFKCDGMLVFVVHHIDPESGKIKLDASQCELVGTRGLSISERLSLHKEKLLSYTKQKNIQFKLMV
jgi:hypothetical protein